VGQCYGPGDCQPPPVEFRLCDLGSGNCGEQ
jgi:hypothetical protein